ncbi:MAG: hypothetical protein P4L87_09935 [Formivibrio sp.]|nr:hypothetical protein [Formivibrio sp.]
MSKLWMLLVVLALTGCGQKIGYEQGKPAVPAPKTGEWRRYGTMPDFDVLVNIDSISGNAEFPDDRNVYVWMVQVFYADQIDGVSKGKFRKKYTRQAIDCKTGRMAGIAVEMTDENDAEVARYDVPGYQWEYTSPPENTYGADFVRQVCKIEADKRAANKK